MVLMRMESVSRIFDIIAKGANADKKEEFVSIIRDVLQKVAETGIDRKALDAGINSMEFRYREADFSSYPKGPDLYFDILGNWLYDDEHPFAQVELIPVFEKLKSLKNTGYFEELIRKYLLDNPHGSVLTPDAVQRTCRKKSQGS